MAVMATVTAENVTRCLLGAKHYFKSFTYINSRNPHNSPRRWLQSLPSFCKSGV